jgi:tRNA-dihydrouridine synthase
MPFLGFWEQLEQPIIGLSPMDGVTDAAFRCIMARHGKPAVSYTEFTAAEGIRAGALRLMNDFLYSTEERPVVAQLFGADPAAFFGAGAVAAALGFDGIDINMGCPAKNVAQRGAGASLIADPLRAQEIVRNTRAGMQAWADGAALSALEVHPAIEEYVRLQRDLMGEAPVRRTLPISVKTRIGISENTIGEWIPYLLEVEPAAIAVHGRTLKQLYTGQADWEAIHTAASLIGPTQTFALGNGDVLSVKEAHEKCSAYQLDGVLIGRAAFGNPWLFKGTVPSFSERRTVALEHARLHATLFEEAGFIRMRKHLLDYFHGFDGARELRQKLMRIRTLGEVEAILLD